MSLYPYNTNVQQSAQSDIPGKLTNLMKVVSYSVGGLAASDDDRFVASADMKVGAYTLLNSGAMPEATVARKLLITVTDTGASDTMGTLTIVGTDLSGAALSETIAPTANTTTTTLNAFLTVSSITGAGWVVNTGADKIKVGTSEAFGLPDKLGDTAQVLFASHNGTKEATAPTVTIDSATLAKNTVDLNTSLNGNAVLVYYMV